MNFTGTSVSFTTIGEITKAALQSAGLGDFVGSVKVTGDGCKAKVIETDTTNVP